MKKYVLLPLVILAIFMVGCTQQVPPAHKGKVLTPSGFTPDVHEPGQVKGFGLFSRNRLVLLETGTQTMKEPVTVKMKDKTDLTFDVRFRTRIAGPDPVISAMFNDIIPQGGRVTLQMVYSTYGRMVLRNLAREVMNDYSVEDVHTNYDRISEEIAVKVQEAFTRLPLEVSDVALGKIQWPASVTAAVNAAAEARANVATIEAQRVQDVAAAKAEKAIKLAEYDAQMVEAKTIRDYNKTIASGITPSYLQYQAIQVQKSMVEAMKNNPKADVIYMPYDAMGTMGAQMQMFGKK